MFPILQDMGFVETGEAYTVIAGPEPPRPLGVWSNEQIFHRSITAYVLSTSPDLVHIPSMMVYQENLDIEIKLEQFQRAGKYRPWSPEVFVRRWRGGYAIGVRVLDEWWDEMKPKIASGVVVHEDKEWNFGTVRLTIAILPVQAIRSFYIQTASKYQTEVEMIVEKDGWKNESLGGAEVGYFGEGYEHRYATVWVQHMS